MTDARIPDHCAWAARGNWSKAYDEAVAEIARLTAALSEAQFERDNNRAKLEVAKYDRDTARAETAMAFEVAAQELDPRGDRAVSNALGQQLCCSGQMCGCQGADVGSFLQYLIRALTPTHATAALAARDKATREQALLEAAHVAQSFGPMDRDEILAIINKDT